jgi:hypothetical protein
VKLFNIKVGGAPSTQPPFPPFPPSTPFPSFPSLISPSPFPYHSIPNFYFMLTIFTFLLFFYSSNLLSLFHISIISLFSYTTISYLIYLFNHPFSISYPSLSLYFIIHFIIYSYYTSIIITFIYFYFILYYILLYIPLNVTFFTITNPIPYLINIIFIYNHIIFHYSFHIYLS